MTSFMFVTLNPKTLNAGNITPFDGPAGVYCSSTQIVRTVSPKHISVGEIHGFLTWVALLLHTVVLMLRCLEEYCPVRSYSY